MKRNTVVMITVALACTIVIASWLRQQKYADTNNETDTPRQTAVTTPAQKSQTDPFAILPDDSYPDTTWAPFNLPPLDSGPCTLEGTVIDQNDSPVPNAEVLAMRYAGEHLKPVVRKAGARCMTEADGSFRFENIPFGSYSLVSRTTDLFGYSSVAFWDDSEHEPVLNRAESTAVVTGTVRNNKGEPVADARVGICSWKLEPKNYYRSAASFPLAATATDKNGAYALRAPIEGHYIIGAEARGYAFASLEDVASGTSGNDFVIVSGGTVNGTVTFANSGKPAPGLTVVAHTIRNYHRDMINASTDDRGSYMLDHLSPGVNYAITVFNERYATREDYGVNLNDREAKTVDLQVSGGGSISGTVTISGTGDPGIGARLILSSPIGGPRQGLRLTASSDDGSFEFTNLSPGEYEVTCQTPENALRPREEVSDGGVLRERVRVEIDRDVTGLEFRFDRAATISGTITDPAGRGVADVRLRGSGSLEGERFSSEAKSDAEGRYTLTRIVPGARCHVEIRSDKFGYMRSDRIDVPLHSDVTDIDFKYELPSSISGRVIEANGRPVIDAKININCRDKNYRAFVKDQDIFLNGEFDFGGIQPGIYRFYVHREGQSYETLSGEVTVTAGQSLDDIKVIVRPRGSGFEEFLHNIF